MIVLQANVNLRREEIEEEEKKVREKTGEDCYIIPHYMQAIDLQYKPWKEEQMRKYVGNIDKQEDKKKRKLSWWNR